jgi:hypothetical protein
MLNDRGERMVSRPTGKSALDIFVEAMGLVLDAGRATSFPAPSHPPPNSYSSPDTGQDSAVATTPR